MISIQYMHILILLMDNISIRSNLRKSITSAWALTRSKDVLSRLLGEGSSDERLKKEVLLAVYDNDVDFIQVLILKRVHALLGTLASKIIY